jgi:hypothetical protein
MTAREAARRYSASWERATVGFATTLLHHWLGHDPGTFPGSYPNEKIASHIHGLGIMPVRPYQGKKRQGDASNENAAPLERHIDLPSLEISQGVLCVGRWNCRQIRH